MTATIDGTAPVDTAASPQAPVPPVAPVEVDASIIVTCHDYGAYVGAAVRSALAQDGVAVEVIVVDDGSTDDSPEVLADLVRTHPGRIELIRQPNRGQAAAMNAGFRRARAPVVLFLDADDVLHPRTAARCIDALARPGTARVQFPMRIVDRDGRPTGRSFPDDPRRLPAGDLRPAVLAHPDDLPWQPTSGNAFSAEALDRILPMPEDPYRTCADHYLSNLSALLGDVAVLDRAGADYRVHGANADHRDHLDVDRLRTVIGHTIATHTELARLANELGHPFPDDPLDVPSVTFFVNRLVSLRLAPERHPLHGDRRLRLVLDGARATRRRQDLPRGRRAAMVGWFAAMAMAPRPVARALAARALLGRAAPSAAAPEPAPDRPTPGAPATDGGASATGRSDWRFLLPSASPDAPRRAIVRGGPAAHAGRGLADLGRVDDVDAGAIRRAGIAAHLVGEPADVAALARSLAPGGDGWIEVDRRRRGSRALTPARLERRARAAGLVVGAAYLIGPSPSQPRRFVPLDHAGALGWYLRTLVVPGSWVQAIGLGVLRAVVATVGPRPLLPLVPSFGVLVQQPRPGGAPPRWTPAAVTAAVGAAEGATPPAVDRGRTILLTSGQDEASRAVLLPFELGARHPWSVVKVASVERFGVDTVAELDRLDDLDRHLPPALARTIPRSLARTTLGRLPVGAQTATSGRQLEVRARSVTVGAGRTIADLDAATAWLIELHRGTRTDPGDRPPGEPSSWRHRVLDPLGALRRDLEGSAAGADRDRALGDLDRIEARSLAALATCCGTELPTVERHHDFVPCNVLRDRRGISVVDWELPPGRAATGPALVDLLLFVTFWYGAAHRSASPDDDLRRLARLLDGAVDPRRDPYHAAAWRAVRQYGAALDIDPDLVPLALVLLWLERHDSAGRRTDRLRAAGSAPSPVVDQLGILARRWASPTAPWRSR